jgi:oligopeptide/dipeptide ABC transporter ATP-binding protein
MQPLLEISNLQTHFFTSRGIVKAIRGIEFSLREGETLALVGESGCGKSMTALSILRLVPPPGRIVEGNIRFMGTDLLQIPEDEMRRIRGNKISMVFQEPMTSLNPVFRIGDQIGEVLRLHKGMDKAEALQESIDLLTQVGIPSPERRVREYPHQLSGGMRQRVVIAMALACDPKVLIADEPTTALDVTIQAQIMELLKSLQQQRGMATLLITHDLGVVAESADHVAIMNSGLIMEYAPVRSIYADPVHPYTQGLLGCIPRMGEKRQRLMPVGKQGKTMAELPPGSSFLDACPEPFAPRSGQIPTLREVSPGHFVRIWR